MTDAYTQPALLRFRDVVHVVLATAGLTLLFVVAGMLLYSVMVMFGFTGTSVLTLPVLFALEAISIVGGIWFGLLRRRRLTWRDIGWLPTRPAWLFAAGFAAIGFYIVLIAGQAIIAQFTGNTGFGERPDAVAMFPPSVPAYLGSLAFGAVAVPMAEELLFRGVLYRWLRDRWGTWPGIFLSALIFALIHPPAAGAAPLIFIIGLGLAWLYEKTGSLKPGMVLHGANNAIGITVIYLTIWTGGA